MTDMYRFYVAEEIKNDNVSISDAEQLHHLKDVLRLKVNDKVIVADGKGKEYTCLITRLTQKQAVLAVKARKRPGTKRVKITVACAIPKNARMDEIVDNLTQLGVDSIIPMETQRVVVRLDDARKEARLKRWRRIAQSASQQSQRDTILLVEPVTDIKSVLARSDDFDLKLIPALFGKRKHIREALAESRPTRILVLIGPEGDFTPDEIEMAESAGLVPVSLGDTVLRVGMAAVAVVSYIKLALGV